MGGGPVDYSRTFTAREVDRRARILSKPEPLMTEAAKRNKTFGTVVMRVTFTAAGEVTNIRVVQGLPDGLSESAVAAARLIKFQPAMKDGRVVSQFLQIEYNFNDY
jgi:TonB family protein